MLIRLCTAILVISSAALFSGCAGVAPWEKEFLAKPHMAFDPNPLQSRFKRHIHESREAASGGYGIAISGCGCK